MSYLTFIGQLHEQLKANDMDPTKWEIRSVGAVSSTNVEAKKLLNFYNKVVILSKIQTKGKGREGRIWHSPEGGIWMSIAMNGKLNVVELSSPIIRRVQRTLLPLVESKVKKPNDLQIDRKKVAGVLVEGEVKGNKLENVVVGLGLNVFNELPEEIENSATTLVNHCSPPSIPELAALLAVDIIQLLQDYCISS